MERERVLCPETGEIEELGYERTELGILVERCTGQVRWGQCARRCAARMDIDDRRDERLDAEHEESDEETTGTWHGVVPVSSS